jgi:hypothetical protein
MTGAEDLQRRAAELAATYRRHTWYRFVLVFAPVPFVVVLVRLHLEAWHYYVAGAAYLLFSAALYSYDTRASTKVDAALRAAEEASAKRP